jgi:hypothetical protein
MPLDPIRATEAITDSYLNYLSTTFQIRDADLQRQFVALLKTPGRLTKGPILEATPPFECGVTPNDLISGGVLSPRFRQFRSEKLPLDRPFYVHQETAIRKVIAADRNIVVATGTGSGKTECFLIPILNHLLREEERGSLSPGVRALLLYPMNALANDQLSRMRELLQNYPNLTFGRYTGETLDERDEALEKYVKMYERDPLPNELISREEMRDTPPHILLTNYAMLEYLLLRPADNAFFDGKCAHRWRFLVVDEAHTYNGAKGIEMAMLFRRLKDRIVKNQEGRLRCIATSATLGDEKDFSEVVDFASQLFNERFEWIPKDPGRQDVIKAKRLPLDTLGEATWSPDPKLYLRWQKCIQSNAKQVSVDDLIFEAQNLGVSKQFFQKYDFVRGDNYRTFLYQVLQDSEHVAQLRDLLEEAPRYLRRAAHHIFDENSEAVQQLVALVDLSAQARPSGDHQPLMPARYHLFARAMEGTYIALRPERRLFLERRQTVEVNGRSYVAFEAAVCRRCGALYVVGEEQIEAGQRKVLTQPSGRYYESTKGLSFHLLLDGDVEEVPENEDEVIVSGVEIEVGADQKYKLCAKCGAIGREDRLLPICDCEEENYVSVIRVPAKAGDVHVCPACGSRSPSSLVWRFLTGKDATASVLATALYQQVPPRSEQSTPKSKNAEISTDPWSSTAPLATRKRASPRVVGRGRQLLIFSDSRQDAAFFAPYLTRTYKQILRRRLILKTLEKNREKVLANHWRVQDLIKPLASEIKRLNLYPEMSQQGRLEEAWKWILHELLVMDRRNGLEGLGCLGFSLVKPLGWVPPRPLMKWGLSEEEVWLLFQILLNTLRTKGTIVFPNTVSPTDEFFAPRNREYYIRPHRLSRRSNVFSWVPKGSLNTRTDFLFRLLNAPLGIAMTIGECNKVLDLLWERSLAPADVNSCWHHVFESTNQHGVGTVFQMKPEFWELRSGTLDSTIPWYCCDKCQNLTLTNLRKVCPTYRCSGTLHECNPRELFRDNHYRRLYTSVEPMGMKVKEHTAQLTSKAAAELQTEFINGAVNVLSCSTTFELGVDVGELEAVFMRNVPPSAANYVQRAGRAGRRTTATAFALTFAQRRSHDLTHFNDPISLVSGKIGTPHFKIANDKIVRRHVYATALSAFWKHHRATFGRVKTFFFDKRGAEMVRTFLREEPDALQNSLKWIVPESMHHKLGIDDWAWLHDLLGDDGTLTRAANQVKDDVQRLEKHRRDLIAAGKPSDYVLRSINTIKRRYLISYLSSQNVIPKYGFPVDVVSLQLLHHDLEARRLELDRDLRIALSEYAPSSQVVAGGKLWTSRYLKRLPDRSWPKFAYAVCDHCGCYQSVQEESGQTLAPLETCRACGHPLEGRNKGTFLVPEFGFSTNLPPKEPGERRPERTYTTRTYFSGEANAEEERHLQLEKLELIAIPASDGSLAVINHAGYVGFKVCPFCGYAKLINEDTPHPHKTPWRSDCHGKLRRFQLGHEFKTDVLQLRFLGYSNAEKGFWLSLLYAILEGLSGALDIDRRDIDGCLYPYTGDPAQPALILFDDVPGGAGHVRRAVQNDETLVRVLETSLRHLERCKCGGDKRDTSCYGCLRNYNNQFCHEDLKRGMVIDFLHDAVGLKSH